MQFCRQGGSFLRFLWRPRTNETVQFYQYWCHLFGTKTSPNNRENYSNYALKRVGLNNEEMHPTAAQTKNNFHVDDFIEKRLTREEAADVFNQLQPRLHNLGLNLGPVNNNAVTEAIAEEMKPISNTTQVAVEPTTEGSCVI